MPSNAPQTLTSPVETPPLTLPHAEWTSRVFWGTILALVLLAFGLTRKQFADHAAAATAAQAHLTAQTHQRWQELLTLARETAALSQTADTASLEGFLATSLQQLPGPAPQGLPTQLHQQFAALALQRADFPIALAELSAAESATKELQTLANLALQRLEIFLAADHATTLAAPAIGPTSQLLAKLPAGAAKTQAAFQLEIIQAETASAQAEATTEQDQMQRELRIAQLKRKGLALSEQLRAELNTDFQKREQAQQDAATQNDPAKMAEAIKQKEAFDEKFSAELKRREEQLQQETTAAMQPNPEISALQATAVTTWQQLAERATDTPWSRRVRLGLAAALLQQQNFPAATEALAPVLAEKDLPPMDQLRASHLSARIHQAQASRLAGAAATAALQQALNAASHAQEQFAKLSLHRPALQKQAADVAATLATLHTALGQKPSAQQFQALAEQHSQAAARDHSWREILWNARAKITQLRQSLRQQYQPPLVDQLDQANQLLTALRQYQASVLARQDPKAASDKVSALINLAPDQYPWSSLLQTIH